MISIIIIKLQWINIKIENQYIQSIILIVSAAYRLFIVYLFRQIECKKKVSICGWLVIVFISPRWWIGNEQFFKVGLNLNLMYRKTVHWGRKWLVEFNAGKDQLVFFDWFNDCYENWSVLEEKSSCWGWLSFLNWIGALALPLLLKLSPRKLGPWFVLWSFFHMRLLCTSINLPYGYVWSTVVMSELVFLVVTWNCWISCNNGYAGLMVLPLLPLLNL